MMGKIEWGHEPAGPWRWHGGRRDLYLATEHSGRKWVMGFQRRGLQGAQPTFRVGGRMVPAADLLQFEVGDRSVRGMKSADADGSVYRYDVRGIDTPLARAVMEIPAMVCALREANDLLADYAQYVRTAPSAELECHPYLPALDDAVANGVAILARIDGTQP